MQKLSIPAFVILLVVGIIACRTNKEELVLKGNEYFPMKSGLIRLYQIDSFIYSNYTGEIDTISSELREEIKERLVDNVGDTFYRVELSAYSTFKSKWEVQQTFTRKVTGNYAIENIYNHPEVKMVFPISKYKTKGSSYVWNMNMLTNDEITNVKYNSVFTTFDNGFQAFNDCVTVGLQKPEAGIINNIREEVYAKDIGLVYRHIDKTDFLTGGKRGGFEIFVRLK